MTTNRFSLRAATATAAAVALCLAVYSPTAWCAGDSAAVAAPDGLFAALGGREGIAGIVDDLVPRAMSDARTAPFFKDSNAAELKRTLVDQFCVVSGGPCSYDGATMKKAHAGLGIARADFNRLVELLQLAMDDRHIPFADQNRLLARLAPMHRDIVEKP